MDPIAYSRMANSEQRHWWFAGRRVILASLLRRELSAGRPPIRILEAGCGSGGNLGMLSTFGEVDAVEHDAGARTIAAQRSGLEVLPCTLPHDLPVSDYTYDLIALLDVLEHIDDDQATLTSLREKLANEGQIIVTVPALPWLWSHHDIINHHKRRYTICSLSATAKRAGFCVDRIGYFNCLLFPIAVVRRLMSIAFRRSIEDDRTPSPFINFFLREIFSLERFVIARLKFPIGLSIFAILKPQNRSANQQDANSRPRLA